MAITPIPDQQPLLTIQWRGSRAACSMMADLLDQLPIDMLSWIDTRSIGLTGDELACSLLARVPLPDNGSR